MARELQRPHVGLVFSNVVAASYDRRSGYVPTYERRRDREVQSIWGTCAGRGLGAAMAVRRDTVRALGGFAFCRGFLRGLTTDVDRAHLLYRAGSGVGYPVAVEAEGHALR
jgi:hypothetical protein